jgi:putative alpha-1,2-mannosidase
MTSWYVFDATGLYPYSPANPSYIKKTSLSWQLTERYITPSDPRETNL